MKVHSQLQKLANKLKTVKPLIKSAWGPGAMNPDVTGPNPISYLSGGSPEQKPEPSSHAFYITNGNRREVPYIKNMPDNASTGAYRTVLLENGIVLLVSKVPDRNGNYKIFTYNDMGNHMPDINSDEMKVLSKLGTAVYSNISGSNDPVTDMLTGERLSLAQVPQGQIPVVIPNSHTGGLLDRGTKGVNNDTIYSALEDMGAVQLIADQIYANGGIQLDPDIYTGDGWFWGQDAPVGTFRKSTKGNRYDSRGTHPMGEAIGHLFNIARADKTELSEFEQQDREAAILRLQQIGYDPELGYIPGLTNKTGFLPAEAYDIQSYKPESDGFTPMDTTKGTATIYDMPNMIGMFVPPESMGNLTALGGASMQYTDPHVQSVNKALFNDEAAQQAFQQIDASYPDFENRKYDPGNLQGDAKILYDLIYRNRQLVDATAREHAKHDSDFMISDGGSQRYPEGFDWRNIPVLANYEGFRSANLNEVNENTNEAQDPFTRFAIASLAHKRYRPSYSDTNRDGRHYVSFNGRDLNMASDYALVSDGRPKVLYNAATHRANHFWHDIRQDYIQYARQVELMRQAMEYAVPLSTNRTFAVHGDDYGNDKANSHLAARAAQQLYPDEDIQQFRMDPRDGFMSHPIIQKSYDRLYNGVLGLPARSVKALSNGMAHIGKGIKDADVPVISPVFGNIVSGASYVPGMISPMVDIPGYFMTLGDLAADGVAEHWDNANDQSSVPIMSDYLHMSSDDPLDNVNPRALTLAYQNASTASERHMGENPEAQGGAEYVMSGLGAAAVASLGLRGAAVGVGNVARALGKSRMSNLVRNTIESGRIDDLVLNMGRGTVLYGDDALRMANQTGTLNRLTLSDDAMMAVANLGQHPQYFQALAKGRYPWVTKPLDFTLSLSGIPRMNFTNKGVKAWGDLYQHMLYTGQGIPTRLTHAFNTVDPFLDAYRFQRIPYHDENNNFITVQQPTGFDPTFGLLRNTTGLNNMEEVSNHITNSTAFTEGLYNTVGQGYYPDGSLVYKPYGNINGYMLTPEYVVENAPWLSYTSSHLFYTPDNTAPADPRFNIPSNYVPVNYAPDTRTVDFGQYDGSFGTPVNTGNNQPTSQQGAQPGRLELINQNGKLELRQSGGGGTTTGSGSTLPSNSAGSQPKYTPDKNGNTSFYDYY